MAGKNGSNRFVLAFAEWCKKAWAAFADPLRQSKTPPPSKKDSSKTTPSPLGPRLRRARRQRATRRGGR